MKKIRFLHEQNCKSALYAPPQYLIFSTTYKLQLSRKCLQDLIYIQNYHFALLSKRWSVVSNWGFVAIKETSGMPSIS